MIELEKAARQALEALEMALRYHGVMLLSDPPKDAWKYHGVEGEANKAITALRRILAEHALDKKAENARELGLDYDAGWKDGYKHGAWASEQKPVAPANLELQQAWDNLPDSIKAHPGVKALHQAKQPAAWVGLTDEEMKKTWYEMHSIMGWYSFEEIARAIEAKLREKNGGNA